VLVRVRVLVLVLVLAACAPAAPPPPSSSPPSEAPAPAASSPPDASTAVGSVKVGSGDAHDAPPQRTSRAKWTPPSTSKWQKALDGYTPVVTPASQVSLHGRTVAFAKYLEAMHRKIHPVFSDTYLASQPAVVSTAKTGVEIVVGKDGHIAAIGVVGKSGDQDFDAAVLESISRAGPFDPPRDEIRSSDDNVYVHWEFFRDETRACALTSSRPFILALSRP
jgi:outer membrane biosynthesis protein TonB